MADLLIVLAFVVYSVVLGFRSRRKASQGLGEYFLAGKTVSGWRAGLSMAATQFAADTPLLVSGMIATGGIFLVWRLWIYGIAFLMMGFIFAAAWRRAGVLTDAELTEIRYSGRGVLLLRGLKAVYYGTLINCVVMAMVLVAAMRIAEVFLPWHEWLPSALYDPLLYLVEFLGLSFGGSISGLSSQVFAVNSLISTIAIVSFTALYSTTGGLRSVIQTDIMQFALAMLGTVIYACVVVNAAGGLDTLAEKVVELYGADHAAKLLSFAPRAEEGLMAFFVIIGLQWFFQMNSDGTGYLAQRTMACRSDREARIAALLFTWVQIVLRSVIWIVIGVSLLVLYPFSPNSAGGEEFTAAREMLFITGIEDYLPLGVRGIMLTALLAALASTIDTHLNWGASYWSNDLYKRVVCQEWLKREPRSRELVLVARLSNIIILLIALTIMANLGSIHTAWVLSLLFGAGMGSVLVLRWLWERINVYSELAAMAASIIVAPFLLLSTETEWIRLAVMAFASTFAAVAVAFVTPRTDDAVLQAFYRKVRPPGFWRRTAKSMAEDQFLPLKKLIVGSATTLCCALSVFFALVGIGKLLIVGVGESNLWAWGYIGFSLVLFPFWWRSVFREEG